MPEATFPCAHRSAEVLELTRLEDVVRFLVVRSVHGWVIQLRPKPRFGGICKTRAQDTLKNADF